MSRSFVAIVVMLWLLAIYAIFCGPFTARAESRDYVRDVVCAPQYAWDCSTALAIVWRESRNQSDALNPTSLCAGWFQVHPMHGYSIEALSDPYFNTQVAYGLWLQRGWQPWTS